VRARLGRIGWVFVVNAVAAYFAVYGSPEVRRLRAYLITDQPLGPTWQDYLRGAIPAAGILFEILGFKMAKYINIGYFVVLTVLWGAICIYNWHDMDARFYSVAYSFLALIVVLVDLRLYRKRRDIMNSVR
jgi:hypothetical protein